MNTPGKERRGLIIRRIYAVCLLGATLNHARIVAEHGFLWAYGGVPVASAAFWTSLTFIDPLAVVMLIAWPNLGVLATGFIIAADVIHNVWITVRYAGHAGFWRAAATDPFLVSQMAFLLFVIETAPMAWKRVSRTISCCG